MVRDVASHVCEPDRERAVAEESTAYYAR
ncbi:hypothetical protein MTO96_040190, partial [Rhipicephalus appendiculatus]